MKNHGVAASSRQHLEPPGEPLEKASSTRRTPDGPSLLASLWPHAAALISALLLAAAYPPFDQGWLCWIALTPLICAVWFTPRTPRHNLLRACWLGYLWGLVFFSITFRWLIEVTGGGWFILSLYFALYPAAWTTFLAIITPRPGTAATHPFLRSSNNLGLTLSASAAWVGLEWIRGTLFSGFGWNNLGTALHDQTALIQIADITGVGGISFLILAANLMLVITVRRLTLEVGRTSLRPHYDFTLTVALVAAAFSYGVHHYYAEPPGETATVKIAAVQANIPQDQKWDEDFENHILDTYRRLTDLAVISEPNLLIWPEAATPRPLLLDDRMKSEVAAVLEKFHGDFLLGTINYDHTGAYNAAVVLSPSGAPQLYYKMHLVPFGEFIPFRHSFPLFAWIVGNQVPSDFNAGTEPVVFELRSWPIKIAPLICFEDTVGDLTRQFALRGAELLVTITNDAWFRESAGSRQHLINAVFRSAETKLPLVRGANTGVTCVIDRLGRVTNILTDPVTGSTFTEGVLTDSIQVPVEPPLTFYTRYGELFSILCFFATLLTLRTSLLRHRNPLPPAPPLL